MGCMPRHGVHWPLVSVPIDRHVFQSLGSTLYRHPVDTCDEEMLEQTEKHRHETRQEAADVMRDSRSHAYSQSYT